MYRAGVDDVDHFLVPGPDVVLVLVDADRLHHRKVKGRPGVAVGKENPGGAVDQLRTKDWGVAIGAAKQESFAAIV